MIMPDTSVPPLPSAPWTMSEREARQCVEKLNLRLPIVGEWWIIDRPGGEMRAVEVTSIDWNGSEWIVWSKTPAWIPQAVPSPTRFDDWFRFAMFTRAAGA